MRKCENPVVRRELRSYGYSYSPLNGELRSYQEFPNHILEKDESAKEYVGEAKYHDLWQGSRAENQWVFPWSMGIFFEPNTFIQRVIDMI